MNMERFINLHNGDTMLCTEDVEASDCLPIADQLWLEGDPAAM